jgi:hypothetical protein
MDHPRKSEHDPAILYFSGSQAKTRLGACYFNYFCGDLCARAALHIGVEQVMNGLASRPVKIQSLGKAKEEKPRCFKLRYHPQAETTSDPKLNLIALCKSPFPICGAESKSRAVLWRFLGVLQP